VLLVWEYGTLGDLIAGVAGVAGSLALLYRVKGFLKVGGAIAGDEMEAF